MAPPANDSDFRFECLTGLAGLEAAAPALDALAAQGTAQAERPWFYTSSAWLLPWARHCCEGVEIFVFLARNAAGEVVAALPMAKQKVRIGRLHTPALTVLGWPATDNFEVPATSAAAREALLKWAWDHARSSISGWTCWMLREVDAAGPTVAAIDALRAQGSLTSPEVFPAGISPMLDLAAFAADGDPRTKKQLYRITKFRRKLDKKGEVEVPFWRVTEADAEQTWQNAVDIESRSWKGEDGDASSLQAGKNADMLREVWANTVPKGALACCEVRLDGQALASHWGYIDGDRFLSFHMAYDNEYRSYGLGSVMLEDMVQLGAGLGLRFIDASRGNTAGTHILGFYGGPVRQQMQYVMPRRSPAGVWVRMHCKARHARARRAEAEAAKAAAEEKKTPAKA